MFDEENVRQLPGRELFDRHGDRIGEISQVYVDDMTDEATWVTVKTGWFGLSESFVPLHGVDLAEQQLRVAYDKATVKDAPRFAAKEPLTARDEDDLHTHYGLAGSDGPDSRNREREQDPADDGRGSGPDVVPAATRTPAAPRESSAVHPRRGRLRQYENRTGSSDGWGSEATRVCPRCGAYVASHMVDRHDEFHRAVDHPAGDFARHDMSVSGRS